MFSIDARSHIWIGMTREREVGNPPFYPWVADISLDSTTLKQFRSSVVPASSKLLLAAQCQGSIQETSGGQGATAFQDGVIAYYVLGPGEAIEMNYLIGYLEPAERTMCHQRAYQQLSRFLGPYIAQPHSSRALALAGSIECYTWIAITENMVGERFEAQVLNTAPENTTLGQFRSTLAEGYGMISLVAQGALINGNERPFEQFEAQQDPRLAAVCIIAADGSVVMQYRSGLSGEERRQCYGATVQKLTPCIGPYFRAKLD
jgi:hypothetical protein